MDAIELTEHGGPKVLSLDQAAGRALASSGVVKAAPHAHASGRWTIEFVGRVGVASIRVPDGRVLTVRVEPKMPVARLLFLLGYANKPEWLEDNVGLSEAAGLVPVMALLFERQAERALRQGPIQGYTSISETSLVVKGRIREADQARRHYGMAFPVEVTHDEYTTDVAENQILRAACECLLKLLGDLHPGVRRRLVHLRSRLVEISILRKGKPIPTWVPSRLNARYHTALRLAELVLRGSSVEYPEGNVTVSGFLVNMNTVFEEFFASALCRALAPRGGDVCTRELHLDHEGAVGLKPDLVWYTNDGVPRAVADAKYKVGKLPAGDVYQMLAYCTALQLSEGHLVRAKGDVRSTSHRIRHTGITIHHHTLDLDQQPADLLSDIQALADRF